MSRRSAIARYTAWRSIALNACSLTAASLGGTIIGVSRDDVLITATELSRRLDAGEPTTILDVRWQLTEPDGRATYQRGHLPGAVYVSLEDELSDHSVCTTWGAKDKKLYLLHVLRKRLDYPNLKLMAPSVA